MDDTTNPGTSIDEFQQQRQYLMDNPEPMSNYATAVYLLKDSKVTDHLPEIEKEIKLSNLDKDDKEIILKLLNSYQDQLFLLESNLKSFTEDVLKQYPDKDNVDQDTISMLNSYKEDFDKIVFDASNHLRRAFTRAMVTRGAGGFEREAQNKNISVQSYSGVSPEMAMMGMGMPKQSKMSRMFGGRF